MKMPTGYFADVVETFSLTTTCQFHWHFPPFVSWKEMQSSPKYIWTPPYKWRSISLVYSPVQLHESTIFIWLLVAICWSESNRKTCKIFWLWMTIPRDQSMNNWSSIWLIVVVCCIVLMNYLTCHNGDKDGDQNIDLPDDQFFNNEGILVSLQLQFARMSICLQLQFVCISVCLQLSQN